MSAAAHRFERAIRFRPAVDAATSTPCGDDLHPGQVRVDLGGSSGAVRPEPHPDRHRADAAATAWGAAGRRRLPRRGDRRRRRLGGPTIVMCSATLDPRPASRLSLRAEYLAVDSPFDFRRHGLLYVPRCPGPTPRGLADAVVDELVRDRGAAVGAPGPVHAAPHVLRAAASMSAPPARRGCPGPGRRPTACCRSAWRTSTHRCCDRQLLDQDLVAGHDLLGGGGRQDPVPGPTDPIVEARYRGVIGAERAFMGWQSVPAAGVQLAQGVGRLIRTARPTGAWSPCSTPPWPRPATGPASSTGCPG